MSKKGFSLFLVALLAFSGCATVPMTGRKQLSFIPSSQLLSLSNENYQTLLKEANLSTDTQARQLVEKVGKRIASAAEEFMRENDMAEKIKEYNWEFNLIESDQANASALPGGKIIVYAGILPITQNEEGLATVLAHEVAHALANHGGERLSQALLVQMGGLTLSQALKEKKETTQQWALLAYGLGSNLGILLPYSRTHESEADHIGLILMARAGYDPREALAFWERMNKLSQARPPQFLSTHPAPANRIEAIRREIPEAMKYYRP